MRSNAKQVIGRLRKKFDAVLKEAPPVLANEGQKYFNQNFQEQKYEGQKWKEPKRKIPGTFEYKYPKNKDTGRRTRPTLVGKTRRLKNAVNRAINWSKTSAKKIVWGVYSLPYAAVHNFGGDNIPRRQFMGMNKTLAKRLKSKFETLFRKIK